MNSLVKDSRSSFAPMPILPHSLFDSPFFGRMMDGLSIPSNLMRRYTQEDGSTVLEYNLAGFEVKDIAIKVDTATSELMITAQNEDVSNRRSFSTSVTLSPYTTPEDVTTSYKNGVLQVTVAPLEKRKAESLVDIPVVESE